MNNLRLASFLGLISQVSTQTQQITPCFTNLKIALNHAQNPSDLPLTYINDAGPSCSIHFSGIGLDPSSSFTGLAVENGGSCSDSKLDSFVADFEVPTTNTSYTQQVIGTKSLSLAKITKGNHNLVVCEGCENKFDLFDSSNSLYLTCATSA